MSDSVAASIGSPRCDGTLEITFQNATARTVAFSAFGDDKEELFRPMKVSPGDRDASIVLSMTKPAETFSVEALGRELVSRRITTPEPCEVEKRIDWGQPVAQDDFDSLDRRRWGVYDSPKAKQHPRTEEAVSVENGVLRLAGGVYDTWAGRRDVSGGVAHEFGQMYGKWEVRFRAEKGEGYSPVVLLWPDTGKWPDDGEIDLIEIPATNRQVGSSWLHNGPKDHKIQRTHRYDFSEWHVISVEWLPNRVSIAIDGVDQWHVIDPTYIPTTSPMHLTLQHDQGTPYTQRRRASTPEFVSMYIDWIKVYAPPANLEEEAVAAAGR